MPHKLIWERTGVFRIYSGVVTGEELEQANKEFFDDPRSHHTRYQLVDLRPIEEVRLSTAENQRTAALDAGGSRYLRNLKIAHVVTRPDIVELIREYEEVLKLLHSNWQARRFATIEEARAWIAEE